MEAGLLLGALLFALLAAALLGVLPIGLHPRSFRLRTRKIPRPGAVALAIAALVGGNYVLVSSDDAISGILGIVLMVGGLGALLRARAAQGEHGK